MADSRDERLRELLTRTSRSFSLGIAGLREPLRARVRLGYLLCRVLDTYEDSLWIDAELRRDCLLRSQSWLEMLPTAPEALLAELGDWAGIHAFESRWRADSHDDEWEHALLVEGAMVWEELAHQPEAVRRAFSRSLADMVSGMLREVEVRQIAGSTAPRTVDETERYCYFVAGTVGCLLTALFHHEGGFGAVADSDLKELEAQGIAFGKALQLVNILKDFHEDWQEGRCFWPGLTLPAQPGTPPPSGSELEAVFALLMERFRAFSVGAHAYTNRLDPDRKDLRFFCLFPMRMAEETLARGAADLKWLNEGGTFKVSRLEMAKILLSLGSSLPAF